MSRTGELAVLEYRVKELDGVPVEQRHLHGYLAKDDACVEIHVSKVRATAADRPTGARRDPRERAGPRPRPGVLRGQSSAMAVLMVVRRGAAERFRFLQEAFAHEPVTITWDRRVAERRHSPSPWPGRELRLGDRRRPPPASWTALQFVVSGGALSA